MTPFPALLGAMMMAVPVQPAPAMLLHVAMCDGSSATIPIERNKDQDRDCPSACHVVLCQSRKRQGSV
jgi:hypothetical protein